MSSTRPTTSQLWFPSPKARATTLCPSWSSCTVESFAEKLLIPAFVFFFFMLYPPYGFARLAKNRRSRWRLYPDSACALELAGGIAAIRSEIIDDCALARRVKRSGGQFGSVLTPDTRSLRRYGSFGEIERMIARTAFNQLATQRRPHRRHCRHGAVYLVPLLLFLLAIGG